MRNTCFVRRLEKKEHCRCLVRVVCMYEFYQLVIYDVRWLLTERVWPNLFALDVEHFCIKLAPNVAVDLKYIGCKVSRTRMECNVWCVSRLDTSFV